MRIRSILLANIFLLVLAISSCKHISNSKGYQVAPPFAGLSLPKDTVTVDPTKEQVIQFKNGASVEIPANSFTDQSGNPVTKPVQVILETMDKPADILASGIPMKYEENGKEQVLQSAGMFNIAGRSEGNPVSITKGKKLAVNYLTSSREDFDLYYFNEENQPKLLTAGLGGGANESETRQGAWKKLSSFVKPNDTSKTLKNFQLKFDTGKYPELAAFAKTNWHLATAFCDPTTRARSDALTKKWTNIQLTKPGKAMKEFTNACVSNRSYQLSEISGFYGDSLISVLQDGYVSVWNLKTQKIVKVPYTPADDNNISPLHCVLNERYTLTNTDAGNELYDMNAGKVVCPLKKVNQYCYSVKNNRLLYETLVDKDFMRYKVCLVDLTGKQLTEVGYESQYNAHEHVDHLLLLPGNKFVINSSQALIVYNEQGKVIQKLEGKYGGMALAGSGIICTDVTENETCFWDVNNNSKKKIGSYWYYGMGVERNFDKAYKEKLENPHLYIEDLNSDNQLTIFNCITKQEYKLESGGHFEMNYGIRNYPILSGYSDDRKTLNIYKLPEKKLIYSLKSSKSERPMCEVDNKTERILLSDGEKYILSDFNGRQIKEFPTQKAVMHECRFLGDGRILVAYVNGSVSLFDKNGNREASFVANVAPPSNSMAHFPYTGLNDRIYFPDQQSVGVLEYNYHGEPERHFGGLGAFCINNDVAIIIEERPKVESDGYLSFSNIRWYQTTDCPPNAWQLNVSNDSESFFTYVYPDEQTMTALSNYQSFIAQKKNEEKERLASEDKLLRRFEIEQFGIYNWDRCYRDDELIKFAADFEFDTAARYSDITVFLVTRQEGNAVIKFPKEAWVNFTIDPKTTNKIIAVLPGNKVAVVTQDAMAAIDWEQVKRDKKLVFKMKTIPGIVDQLKLLDSYL